ncbi:MAG: CZB domain-containing protein [Proteobacteria bacterium]|nr:CZB domain-containing protein [Pseudomonadota bacterium]
MNLEEAVQRHAEWKLKFRAAIAKKEQMDAATIGKDNCCVVGVWLYGDGKARWGSRPEFQRAMDKHTAFHSEAGKVASLINAGKYAVAEAALGSGTSYASASGAVGVALIALKKAVAL